MEVSALTKYDLEAYPYSVRPFSHPARMASLATLYGLQPAPFRNCRVLEIGGGDGINVINMALSAPDSQFVNFDLSSVAIENGRALVRETGLTNLRLEAMDILTAGEELGKFDYVIAHGVYAWVPLQVREKLMALIGRILTPCGIALVSYNSAPGCHIRRAIRDMVYRAAAPYQSAVDRTRVARELLSFHSRHWDSTVAAQAVFLGESERILKGRNNVLFHDELSDEWHPQFISDVVAEARRNGLDYLGDSQLELVGNALFPDDFAKEAARFAGDDFAALEQMRDYRDARSFRISLLCRAGQPIDRAFQPDRLSGLFADGLFLPLDPDARGGKPFGWQAINGMQICTSDERFNALCERLNQAWPDAVSVEDVAPEVDMKEALGKLFSAGGAGLVSAPYGLTTAPGARPMASRVARAQIARGANEVSTLRHTQVRLEDHLSIRFLAALDGTCDRDGLIVLMQQNEADCDRQVLAEKVDQMIGMLTTHGLMER